jgi:signal transduction histidine kinase
VITRWFDDAPALAPEQLRANRFDLLARLSRDLSHEIRNPLHSMVINLELVRRRVSGDETADALARLDVIEREIRRLHLLVDGVLRLARPTAQADRPPAPIPLDTAVDELMPVMAAAARVSHCELEYRPAGADVAVAMQPAELGQAVLNLFLNALDAVVDEPGRIVLAAGSSAAGVELQVQDDGPGIASERVAALATPGFSTRPGRPGLGLAAVAALSRGVGGRLRLQTPAAAGRGCTFTLVLPRPTAA